MVRPSNARENPRFENRNLRSLGGHPSILGRLLDVIDDSPLPKYKLRANQYIPDSPESAKARTAWYSAGAERGAESVEHMQVTPDDGQSGSDPANCLQSRLSVTCPVAFQPWERGCSNLIFRALHLPIKVKWRSFPGSLSAAHLP